MGQQSLGPGGALAVQRPEDIHKRDRERGVCVRLKEDQRSTEARLSPMTETLAYSFAFTPFSLLSQGTAVAKRCIQLGAV